jgi:predicted ATPase
MYRFGGCSLDPDRRELHRDGERVHLEPQAFDLLVYLVEHRDRVVGKVELLDGVWGHGFLSESNLTTRVKEARRAIGDDGSRQEGIANVRGRGYRFVAPVEVVDPHRPAPRHGGLLGRDVELAAAVELLRTSALTTLIGPGGVGKSALARAIAAEVGPSCPDGSWVVELASLDAGAAVLPTVARCLDLVVDDLRGDDTLRAMARLDALLVLDSCEHVVDEVAELVDGLLAVPDGALRIVATSRVRLGSSAESVLPVEPLEVEAARALFAARARAVVPSWDLATAGADRIDRLVDELDRLPLTVEMAAARLGSMTLDELEQAIHSGASLLQLNHRATARRHRSLESVVDWSATLLDPGDRAVLDGFSVFAGPVIAADAAAVLGPDDPGRVRSSLAALAERSLLVADLGGPAARYSMLGTVRAVTGGRLAAHGATDDLRARHAGHIVAVLRQIDDQLRTPEEAEARTRLSGVIDEARAAHRWAQEHEPMLASDLSVALFHAAHSSLWFEPADWARAVLERYDTGVGPEVHGALLAASGAAAHRGDLTAARTAASTVAEVATGRPRAIALEVLADVALYEGDLPSVRRLAEELLPLGHELADAHVIAFAALDASLARAYGGDPDGALADLDLPELATLSPTDTAWVEYARGEALSSVADRGASDHYRRAVELGSSVGSRFVVSVALTSLATELARTDDLGAALTAYADALADFRRHGNHTHALTAVRNLVGLLGAVGDDRGAVLLGAATTADGLRPSYGAEASLIADALESARTRVGDAAFGSWHAEGRRLDLDQCLRTAAALVEDHRR